MPAATATGCASVRRRPLNTPASRASPEGFDASARAFPAKLQRELDRLPDRIAALEGEIATLEARLADPGSTSATPRRLPGGDELAALSAHRSGAGAALAGAGGEARGGSRLTGLDAAGEHTAAVPAL